MFDRTAQLARHGAAALYGIVICFALAGCASSYATPGAPADLRKLGFSRAGQTDSPINETLEKKPLATFPCSIVAVRIQALGYKSDTAETYGSGNYCVVTNRDIETEADMKRLVALPMCTGVTTLSRLLLPEQLQTDMDLRKAAASLHADMLLVYTIDTSVHVEDHLAPLTVVTIGLAPTMTADVTSTASAVLIDTRNGYVYGHAEATEHGSQLTNGWMTEAAGNDSRKRIETRAFTKLVDGFEGTWSGVIKNYAGTPRLSATGEAGFR